ncbi:MAG TPA: hypothetical protein VIJ22_01810, partial [Polyangiaceae bacterium]
QGMQAPTVGPPRDEGPTATSPQLVDRAAATHSYVPDVLPAPQQGTSAGSAAVAPAQAAAFRWPPEPPVARTEEPHVRSLSGPSTVPKSSVAPVVAAVLLMVGLALASAVLVVMRMRGPSSEAAANRPSVATASPPPPLPQPVVVMPAPTLAPPALEDPPASSVVPAASASSTPPRAVTTAKPTLPAAKPPAATAAPVRPGPGF